MKKEKGITLIALIVTIVVLLILASISIKILTGDNGLINQAKNGKDASEISEEKEIVNIAVTQTIGKDKLGDLSIEGLQKELDKQTGEGKTEVSDAGEKIEVCFIEKERYYEVDKEGKVSDEKYPIDEKNAGDITKGGELDGSEKNPYEISCIEDLVVLSNIVNGAGIKFENGQVVQITKPDDLQGKYFTLTRSLNFKSKYSYEDSTRTDFGNINGDDTDGNSLMTEMTTGTGFTSIGYAYVNPFSGDFNGQGNRIDNLMIKNENRNDGNGGEGLFGNIVNSKISNLELTGNIDGGKKRTGGIVAQMFNNSQIANCFNRCNIVGQGVIGGIVGMIHIDEGKKIIANCYNEGNLETKRDEQESTSGEGGYESIGGICGILGRIRTTSNDNDIYIINCYNSGQVQNNSVKKVYKGAGGIIGSTTSHVANIYNCYNIGKVTGTYSEGTIVGGYWYGEWISNIKNCYYLKDTSQYVIGSKKTTQEFDATEYTEQEMKEQELITKLNDYVKTYNEENKNNEDFVELKQWEKGEDGYPTFIIK